MLQITVNGKNRQIGDGSTITDLIALLDLVGKRIAVENNGQIVPRSQHSSVPLTDGDDFEIVVAVGGG